MKSGTGVLRVGCGILPAALFWVAGLSPLVAEAQVYRCRDQSGLLLMTDDPSKFPPGCRPVEEDSDTAGALSVAPAMDESEMPAAEAEELARREQAARAERQALIAEWKIQAQELADAYQAAVTRRNQAYNRWNYSSREVVRQSLEAMDRARAGKEQLLEDMAQVFVPAHERAEVDEILQSIPSN
ncbi:DUF4124 domain-containing protein [Geoalkalibacter sp.]|uniref:DUF4124 domain-containing protein n=1 Tax=Geoalkalibacter sp. TaxID=3041440 RepID=UPI00272E2C56|nr:DUF4124 domain-containing protein [Geoalkalibacter sp.]